MPTYQANLSVSSLDALLNDLKAYQKKVEDAPGKICDALLDTGKEVVEQVVDGIQDPIGNAPGIVTADRKYAAGEATAALNYIGSQVAFIEYGVGVKGAEHPHPVADEANWHYNSGKHIRLTNYWRYYDRLKGKYRVTQGMPARMPVLRASLGMRLKIAQAAKEALK